MPDLRVCGLVEESIVDGPGLRFVVFVQGCLQDCPGCQNPQTHALDGGSLMNTEELLARFDENPLLSGITLSGGEPFLQPEPLAELAREVHRRGKTVMVYSGYTYEQLLARAAGDAGTQQLLDEADILVDGPYVEALRNLELTFRGSENQRVLDRQAMQRLREAAAASS